MYIERIAPMGNLTTNIQQKHCQSICQTCKSVIKMLDRLKQRNHVEVFIDHCSICQMSKSFTVRIIVHDR